MSSIVLLKNDRLSSDATFCIVIITQHYSHRNHTQVHIYKKNRNNYSNNNNCTFGSSQDYTERSSLYSLCFRMLMFDEAHERDKTLEG